MDKGNQNTAKNADSFRKKEKNPDIFKKETPVQLLEDKGQKHNIDEFHSNQSTSKANFVKKENKNKFEKAEPVQKEKINSEEKLQNDSAMIDYSKSSNKNFNASEKHKKNKNTKKSFKKRTYLKTLETKGQGLLDELNGETFDIEDMINNSIVMDLVQDLVNSFTSNSTMPEKDLQALKESLIQKTCFTFANILNICVTKTFNRVLNSDFIQEFKEKPVKKKDACCQTVVPHFSGDIKKTEKEYEIHENVYIYP